jgi:telomerase Cajal body protein 1
VGCRCGNFLYTRGRKDSNIYCWDIRNTLSCLYSLEVPGTVTNQRLMFDIEPCGRHMLAGGAAGSVLVFDLATGETVDVVQVAADTVSGLHLHGTLPLAVTCSGHRRFWDDSSQKWSEALQKDCNTLRVWHLRASSMHKQTCEIGNGVEEPTK